MGYESALTKAWDEVAALTLPKTRAVKFLADEYSVDIEKRQVLSLSCNVSAKDFLAIILLHYVARSFHGLPQVTGRWVDFREFAGVEGYESAFRARVVNTVIRKFGKNPGALLEILTRFPGEKANLGDVGVILEPLAGVKLLILLWKADNEFGPEANVLFDASMRDIFCIEDAIVLAEITVRQL
ncbi:MAG TPA: DUF3786 domain-containing protein [Candidatus Omnitrophota bacterium]|nr:DUF3786 domain-containing protein [Candidatus Omnitrophota bacterium]